MRKIVSLLFIFTLLLSGIAQADTAISAAGAAGLKKQVEDDLQWRVDMAKVLGQGISTDGKVEIIPKADFYEVKLPHISLLTGPKGKLDIGTIAFNATPGQKPGTWQIQATLPSAMTFYSAANDPLADITLGNQRFSGTWYPDMAIYPKIDLLLQNIRIKSKDQSKTTVDITAIKALIDLKDNGDSSWNGSIDAEFSGINASIAGAHPVTIGVGEVSSHTIYDRLDMNQALKAKEEIQKYLKAGTEQADKSKQAYVTKLLSQSSMPANGLDGKFQINKFHLHAIAPTEQEPPRDLNFDKLTISSTAADAQQEKGHVSLKTNLSGLHDSFVAPVLADLLPQTFNAEITIDNLPIKKMADLLFTTIQKSADKAATLPAADGQNQTKADMSAMMDLLPKMFQEDGTSVSIQNTSIKSTALETTLSGKLDANAASPLGAIGKMTLTIKGLDEFIKKLQGSALQPGADPHVLGYLGGLSFLQMRGHPDRAADGTSLSNYIFELTQDGKTLLNGVDLKPSSANQNSPAIPPGSMQSSPAPSPLSPEKPAIPKP